MSSLLRTKLFLPQRPKDLISRPHLVERLNSGVDKKLSLIIAPAGYGKSTLASMWLYQLLDIKPMLTVLWLSLDQNDNVLTRFFTYFSAAIAQNNPLLDSIAKRYLQDTESEIATESLIIELLNEIAAVEKKIVLVLDDYHVIENESIHAAISTWLVHQPPNFHLIITSRVEPPLQLPRLRVRRQINEIDMAALRFSRFETAEFFNQHMELDLADREIDQLDQITEGWVASLQLASISLKNSRDKSGFIQSFKGNNRYIVDYLVSEVLEQQSNEIRDFLLQTSILERFNVALCQAITQNDQSQQVLEQLDRDRLFLIPLDESRHWYRYHHLFAEYLRSELRRDRQSKIADLHMRATDSLQAQGLFAEAIKHAFEGAHTPLAAELIGINARGVLASQGEPGEVWRWVQRLPAEMVSSSPELLIVSAWIQLELFSNRSSDVDDLLTSAEALLVQSKSKVASEDAVRMDVEIALIRNNLARLRGDLDEALKQGERASTLAQKVSSYWLKMTNGSLTITHFLAGNISQFIKMSSAQLDFVDVDFPISYGRLILTSYLIDGLRMSGQLSEAQKCYERLEPFLHRQEGNGTAVLAISWASILYEWNRFDEAIEIITRATEILRPIPSMQAIIQTGSITLSHIYQAKGQADKALLVLKEAENRFEESGESEIYAPLARVKATEALIHLREGNFTAVKSWIEQSNLLPTDNPIYLKEIDHLVLARYLISMGDFRQALILLEKLNEATSNGGRVSRRLIILLLLALVQHADGVKDEAQNNFELALNLGQSSGYLRTIVDEGDALIPLLKNTAVSTFAKEYIAQLLPHFNNAVSSIPKPQHAETTHHTFVNPLTEREMTTLHYLTTNLSIPEIAAQMVVAPSTIRTYVKRIYSKLDVHTRIEAVNRAHTLKLFDK